MDLIGIGGAHIDRIGRTIGAHLPGTSNPGRLSENVGGGVFNALRVAALRKAGSIAIVSERGADSAGALIEQAIEAAGITDLSGVSQEASTATYTALLDQTGELITALADMTIYGDALSGHLRQQPILAAIADASAVLIDANISETAVETICEAARGPVFGIAISAAKVARLKASARAFDIVFMNHHEARLLSGEQDIHLAARHCVETIGFKNVVVTQGERPVLIVHASELWSIEVPKANVVGVTGAGDALCGGTVAALLRDPNLHLTQTLPNAVREGIACANLTLGKAGPLCPAIATNAFADALTMVRSPSRRPAPRHPVPLPTRNAI